MICLYQQITLFLELNMYFKIGNLLMGCQALKINSFSQKKTTKWFCKLEFTSTIFCETRTSYKKFLQSFLKKIFFVICLYDLLTRTCLPSLRPCNNNLYNLGKHRNSVAERPIFSWEYAFKLSIAWNTICLSDC